jgi:hypothetical protein
MSPPSRERVLRVLEYACHAPSVHNTQPWLWRMVGTTALELYADRTRQLLVADPHGRNLVLSCGAALHHAVESARSLGMHATVELVPDATDSDLLARIELTPGRAPDDAATRLEMLEQRCTDRRRFTAWPIPDVRLTQLAEIASGWGAQAVPITEVKARFRAELLLERAMTLQAADERFTRERASWVDRSPDGVPVSSARLVESSDGMMAICTAYDDQASWLLAGQTLSALWLAATRAGLSIVPLSQVIEVQETRDALHDDVFAGRARPQLLLRVGWQEISRTTLPPTPRRPVADVMMGRFATLGA